MIAIGIALFFSAVVWLKLFSFEGEATKTDGFFVVTLLIGIGLIVLGLIEWAWRALP